jgi:hypothetical protein
MEDDDVAAAAPPGQHDVSEIVDHWENVPSRHMEPRSLSPLWKRNVRSGRQPSRMSAPQSQSFS